MALPGVPSRTAAPSPSHGAWSSHEWAGSVGECGSFTEMDQATHNKIVSLIWGIADDVLRDLFKRGKYPDVILPMCVLRRMDAVLEPTKQAVLDTKVTLDQAGITEQHAALCAAAQQAFYNTSKFSMRDLRSRGNQQQLKADFEDYLNGCSQNVQDILENFKFRNQIPTLSKADALATLFEKFLSPEINLSPSAVLNGDGSVKHPAMDNHSMGTVFEELVRKFNEENKEEAGEHWTPRDAVRLMTTLMFRPIADKVKSGSYLLYDCACGTGGMLTVAEELPLNLFYNTGIATHVRVLSNRNAPHRKGKVQLIDASQWYKPLRKNLARGSGGAHCFRASRWGASTRWRPTFATRARRSLGHVTQQRLERYRKRSVELDNHELRERPLLLQNFGGLRSAPEELGKLCAGELPLLHPEFDGLYRGRRRDRMMLSLIRVHQLSKHVELIELWGAGLRPHQNFDSSYRLFVIALCSNGSNRHGCTFLTSILSYSACVPKNLMKTMCAL